jgi:protein-tyrosine kinase
MNRIQQILSKAERDGTARRLTVDDDPAAARVPPPAPLSRAAVIERPAPERPDERPRHEHRVDAPVPAGADATAIADDEAIGEVLYAAEPASAHPAVTTTLDPLLVAALAPLSAAAEQFRSLRARIGQSEDGRAIRVIQITSPGKQDGKTVTALNLALTMAQEFQRRVLIIDADLRAPRIHALLGLDPGPGVVDVLTGAARLEDALVELPEYHLTVLRAGRTYDRPAEMLGSGPMRRLIDTLRSQFDRIVIDSAPAIVADPGAIAPLADGLLLVVRANATTKPAIARAIGTLGSAPLVGLVFNESGAPLQEQYSASA